MPVANTTGHIQQVLEWRAHRYFIITRLVDMPGDRKQFNAAIIRFAQFQKPLPAIKNDRRHRGQGLGIVDGGRPAIEAEVGRKRWFESRLTLFTFQ